MLPKANGKKPFRPEPRTALLKFEGTDYDGLEVKVRLSVPVEQLIQFQQMAGDEERQMEVYTAFGDATLLEWNLAGDDGQILPANGEGFLKTDPLLAGTIIQAWIEAVQQPAAPLSRPSAAIDTSLERSMPMATP